MKKVLVIFITIILLAGCQTKEEKAQELFSEALKHIEQNEMTEAEQKLALVLESGIMDLSVLKVQFDLYSRLHKKEQLVKTAEKLLKLKPSHNGAIKIVSDELLEKGDKIGTLRVISLSKTDELNQQFDQLSAELLDKGRIGLNGVLTHEEYYTLLKNRYLRHGKVVATGAALYQILGMVDFKNNPKEAEFIILLATGKLMDLRTNVQMDNIHSIASGYRLAYTSASGDFKNSKELIRAVRDMNNKVLGVHSVLGKGGMNFRASDIRKKIFLHRIISEKIEKLRIKNS